MFDFFRNFYFYGDYLGFYYYSFFVLEYFCGVLLYYLRFMYRIVVSGYYRYGHPMSYSVYSFQGYTAGEVYRSGLSSRYFIRPIVYYGFYSVDDFYVYVYTIVSVMDPYGDLRV